MRKFTALLLAGILTLSLTACGASADQASDAATEETVSEETAAPAEETTEQAEETKEATEENTGLANPWTEITEGEAAALVPNGFSAPEGATNVVFSKMEADEAPLVQMTFDLDGNTFTAREQMTCDEKADISGMYYEWAAQDDITLANWAGGQMTGKTYRYIGDEGYADLCTWFDLETGASYSLSVTAPDLDGFDIQGVAEAIYDPDKQESALIPDEEEHTPPDITGCDTFTQIVDTLEDGWGFANVNIDGVDVLLVTSYMYAADDEGDPGAIDADIYFYNEDGAPEYAGYVTAGGTAYPLAVANGKLYVGSNHWMKKMTIEAGFIMIDEEAIVEYDESGNATYYHHSDLRDLEDADENGQVKDDSVLNELYEEYMNADTIAFLDA
ncbi:MAG: hypothetical protein K6G12_09280 [Lachnospiraceae bacterium]|nr:hypothetical protein [Lachnospiraceae bacterium]